MFNLQQTIEMVQTNCDIADARHAQEMGMCNYLLGMRDFYRWEKGLTHKQQIIKGDLGAWLTQREEKLNALEDVDYRLIQIDGHEYEPFDYAAINRILIEHGFVYGSGYGYWGRPQFFLAKLIRSENRSNIDILVSGQEYARNMAAPPAAQNQNTIFILMDIMQSWLFGKLEIWGIRKSESALKAMLECYGVTDVGESKLEFIATQQSETLILHEVGEALAEPLLGESWRRMVSSFQQRRSELIARAVRDNLADCLSTLPELLNSAKPCSLHFYFSNFEGMRRTLFPSLVAAYDHWLQSGETVKLENVIASGKDYWLNVARQQIANWINNPAQSEDIIGSFCGENSKVTL